MAAPAHRVAVVGAGPSGFYAAGFLLDAGFEVDLLDELPTPFGLVRAGVAPDHPKIKSVTRVYEKTARQPGFRFFGGVSLGRDVTREELLERYSAVVYAVGTATDRRLGIPGEDLPGCHSATEFVAWYNGHPAYTGSEFDLSARRAVVVGNGNVALDVARMLVLEDDELRRTDTADHAIEALSRSGVEEVVVLGRRGPAQAAFTSPELLELGELVRADVVVDPAEAEPDPASAQWLASEAASAGARRNVEIMRDYAGRPRSERTHSVVLRFLRSPVEVVGEDRVEGLRVVRNRIEARPDGSLRAVPTGEEETIPCGLVLRSIGYRGVALPGVAFDPDSALIPTASGRVLGEDGRPSAAEYAVGWIKRGPSGVIGTNKKCAKETVASVVEDAEAGRLGAPGGAGSAEEIEPWLRSRAGGLVTWDGWTVIDEHERRTGEPEGRPRVKLVDLERMAEVAEAGRLVEPAA